MCTDRDMIPEVALSVDPNNTHRYITYITSPTNTHTHTGSPPHLHTCPPCTGLTTHICKWRTPSGVLSYCSWPSGKHTVTVQQSVNTAAETEERCGWGRGGRERIRERFWSAELNRASPVLFSQEHSGHVPKPFNPLGLVSTLSALTLQSPGASTTHTTQAKMTNTHSQDFTFLQNDNPHQHQHSSNLI